MQRPVELRDGQQDEIRKLKEEKDLETVLRGSRVGKRRNEHAKKSRTSKNHKYPF